MSTSTNFVALPGSYRRVTPHVFLSEPAKEEQITVLLHLRRKRALHSHGLLQSALPLRAQVLREYFGALEDDVLAVLDFANSFDLFIEKVERGKCIITLRATVAAFERAFRVKLEMRSLNGKAYRIRSGSIYIPSNLLNVVTGVFGLDNRPQANPHFVRRAGIPRDTLKPPGFDGNQLSSIYDFPAGDGSGQALAIIELGGGYTDIDLVTFFQSLGLNCPSVTSVSVNGGSNKPGLDLDADVEVALDIEVAGAVVPAAKIIVYFAPNDDAGFLQAVLTAIHDDVNKPSAISISWGQAESAWTQQLLSSMNDAFQSAAALGISVMVAAGDDGANDNQNDGHAHVDFPSSSPFVTACGGTTLSLSDSQRTETVWNDGDGSATGGGISDFFDRPLYQLAVAMPPNLNTAKVGRGVPDISAVADPNTGYATFVHGFWQIVGGTSTVAPLITGLAVRINQAANKPVGLLNNRIYGTSGASAFNDITSGNNSCDGVTGYSAATGWDPVSGLGSPIGQAVLGLFASPPPPVPPAAPAA